jgi:hypothetical protein
MSSKESKIRKKGRKKNKVMKRRGEENCMKRKKGRYLQANSCLCLA